jgi:hypothetical protein
VGVDPLAAGTLALEHLGFYTVVLRVVWPLAQTVQLFPVVIVTGEEVLGADVVPQLARAVDVPVEIDDHSCGKGTYLSEYIQKPRGE